MKIKSTLILLFAMSIVFTSCKKDEYYVTPSGYVTTENKPITDFNEVEVSNAFNVYITFSESEESVSVEADNNLQSYIYVIQIGNRLVVTLDDKIKLIRGQATLNVYITLKELKEIDGIGATNFYFQNDMIGNSLDVALDGACTLNGMLTLNELVVKITGSSNLFITGQANYFNIDALGACKMEGYDFETNILEADLEGASSMSLTVNEKMDIKAKGASNIYYKGNAIIESQNLSGGSYIVKVQ